MYTLNIGCYDPRNYFTSRDSEIRTFDSLEKAMESYNSSKSFWYKMGYRVWFAKITDSDGNEVFNHE